MNNKVLVCYDLKINSKYEYFGINLVFDFFWQNNSIVPKSLFGYYFLLPSDFCLVKSFTNICLNFSFGKKPKKFIV